MYESGILNQSLNLPFSNNDSFASLYSIALCFICLYVIDEIFLWISFKFKSAIQFEEIPQSTSRKYSRNLILDTADQVFLDFDFFDAPCRTPRAPIRHSIFWLLEFEAPGKSTYIAFPDGDRFFFTFWCRFRFLNSSFLSAALAFFGTHGSLAST